MSTQKPSIVFVHGAYHTPEGYQPLLSVLEAAGYSVTAPHLPSTQEGPAIQSIDPDVEAVRVAVVKELDAGHDVVLVVHSYGGVAGTQALRGLSKADRTAEGKSTGVTAIVCIAANLMEEGEAMMDNHLIPKEDEERAIARAMKDADGYLRVTPEEAIAFWYNCQPPDVAAKAAKLVRPWAMPVAQSKGGYPGWRHIPTTYIYATEDKAMLPEVFERVMGKKKDDGITPVLEIIRCEGADHSPFLDRPDWVGKVVRKVAGEGGITL